MTNREFFEAVITLVNDTENPLSVKATEEIAKLNKANDHKKSTRSSQQIANDKIKVQICEHLATCEDFIPASAVAIALGLSSTSKASSLLSQLIAEDKVEKSEIKVNKRKTSGYKLKQSQRTPKRVFFF